MAAQIFGGLSQGVWHSDLGSAKHMIKLVRLETRCQTGSVLSEELKTTGVPNRAIADETKNPNYIASASSEGYFKLFY